MRCVAFVAGQERHHDVGEPLLGTDERRRVGLAAVQLRQYLVGRIAAPRAVAIHLPPAPQVFGRRQIDPYVVGVADLGGVVTQQALDDGERARLKVHGRREGAVGVPVYGLQDRVAAAQVGDVLADDVHVVAVRVQRRDVVLLALLTVVAVVVVEGDVRHLLLAENPHESARDGRLARRRVADDAQDDGAWHELPPQLAAWRSRAVGSGAGSTSESSGSASANTRLLSRSLASMRVRSSRVTLPPSSTSLLA